jgi:DNA-binding SARP family transcriptional activator
MVGLHLRLLGEVDGCLSSGTPLDAPKKAKALLAYLALAPRAACHQESLAALLWSDTSETQARQSLRKTLSPLRQALAGFALMLGLVALHQRSRGPSWSAWQRFSRGTH